MLPQPNGRRNTHAISLAVSLSRPRHAPAEADGIVAWANHPLARRVVAVKRCTEGERADFVGRIRSEGK